jgi:hypothetical protein
MWVGTYSKNRVDSVLGNINFSVVDEADNRTEVYKMNVLKNDNGMFARIVFKDVLKEKKEKEHEHDNMSYKLLSVIIYSNRIKAYFRIFLKIEFLFLLFQSVRICTLQ